MFFDPFFSNMGFFPFLFIIFGIFISILWSLLPFAIFGTKQRLDRIIDELEKLNSRIEKLENIKKEIHSKMEDNADSSPNNNIKNSGEDNYAKYMPNKNFMDSNK